MTFKEFFEKKLNDEEWIKEMMNKYNLSFSFPKTLKYTLQTQAYAEWRRGNFHLFSGIKTYS
tara:strand:- start:718 stop:903 length:186 start_codon:yes stop_codon:yes gene_type:complete